MRPRTLATPIIVLLLALAYGGPTTPSASAIVPPEPPSSDRAPVFSWHVGLPGDSVYERLLAQPEGSALLSARQPEAIAPLAGRLEVEVLAGQTRVVDMAEAIGARVVSRYSASANGLLIHATREQAAILARRPDVDFVELAPIVTPQLAMSTPHIGATRLASELGYDGTGSYVAVIDTGVDYTHAHLGGPGVEAAWTVASGAGATEVITDTYQGEILFPNDKVVAGWDFVGRNYNPPHICTDADMANGDCTNIPEPDPDPLDGGNHGTHVSGIVAGQAIDGIGDGVAPGAKIVGLKLYGRGGADEAADVLADAIDYTARVNLGIEDRGVTPPRVDAINISLGEGWAQGSRLFDEVVEAATGTGVAIASSAGNSGDTPFILGAPSASPKMMSVASSLPPSVETFLNVVFRWDEEEVTHDGIDSSIVGYGEKGAVEGDLAWMGRACEGDEQFQEVAEKVALVARGECPFVDKLLSAQEAGAIAVVMFTDNRGKNSMGGSDAGIDIPSLMIDNQPGQDLSELLMGGTSVTVSIDPEDERVVPLPGDDVSGFSSRGPSKNGALKPDITAPGSGIVSALAGSGDGGAAFSGTSMASPMMAGAAAVIQQRNRDENLGLDGVGVSQLLMNYALPVVYQGPQDNLVPIVRQGAGRVDLWGSGTGTLRVAAGDIASINLGMVSLTEAWTEERTITVYNHGSESAAFLLTSGFQSADDVDQGLSIELPERPLEVAAGESLNVTIEFVFDPAALRVWDQWPDATAGTGQMNALELDGYLRVVPAGEDGQPLADAPVVGLPFYALPRRASDIEAGPLAPALDDEDGPIALTNDSEHPGRAELFFLPTGPELADAPGDVSWVPGIDPDEPDVLQELDIRAVGLRVEPATDAVTQTMLSFALARHERAAIPRVTRYEIYIDADGDGSIDHRVWETLSQGSMTTRYGEWDPEAGAMVEDTESGAFTRHATDLHGHVSILSVPAAALGGDEVEVFQFYVVNQGTNEDWLFMPGTRYDLVPSSDVAPDGAEDGARYHFDPSQAARLPQAWGVDIAGGELLGIPLERGPGEVDFHWLLVYPQNAHDSEDRQVQVLVPGAVVEPEPPDGIYLPVLHRGEDGQ